MDLVEIIRVIIATWLVAIVPGYFFIKKIYNDEEIFISMMLVIWSGAFFLPTIYYIFNEIVRNFLMTFLVVTSIFYVTLLSFSRRKQINEIFKIHKSNFFKVNNRNNLYNIVTLAVFLFLILRSYYPYLVLNPIGPFGTDLAMHSFFVKNIINYGAPLLSEHEKFYFGTIYPYTLDYLIASIALISRVAVYKVFLLLSPISYVLIGISIFTVTRKLLDKNAALLAIISFSFLFTQPYQTLLDGSINELLGIYAMLCALTIGLDYIRKPSLNRSLLLGLVMGSITWFHPIPAFIFTPTVTLLFFLILWKTRSKMKVTLLSIFIGLFLLFASIAIRHQLMTYFGYVNNIIKNVLYGNSIRMQTKIRYARFPQSFYTLSFNRFLVLFSSLICPFLVLCTHFKKKPINTILLLCYYLSNFIFTMKFTPECPNRVLRDFTIPLSMVLGAGLTSFIHFVPKNSVLKIKMNKYIKSCIKMRPLIIAIIFILVIFLSIAHIAQLLAWQIRVAKTLNYLRPEIMDSISYLNSNESGNILTDFSGAWLPYFYENGMVIINNPKKFDARELFYDPNSELATKILKYTDARYVYLAYFGKGFWYPKGSLMPYKNLEHSERFEEIYHERIGGNGYIKIYKIKN